MAARLMDAQVRLLTLIGPGGVPSATSSQQATLMLDGGLAVSGLSIPVSFDGHVSPGRDLLTGDAYLRQQQVTRIAVVEIQRPVDHGVPRGHSFRFLLFNQLPEPRNLMFIAILIEQPNFWVI